MELMTSVTLSRSTGENKDTYMMRGTTLTQYIHRWCSVSACDYNNALRQRFCHHLAEYANARTKVIFNHRIICRNFLIS